MSVLNCLPHTCSAYRSMSLLLCVFLSAVLSAGATPAMKISPDDVIRHYGIVYYDMTSLLANHQRVLQGLDAGLVFSIQALGRVFDLRLIPEIGVFSPTHKLKYVDGPDLEVNTSHIYTGLVHDIPGSIVHLSVLNGQIEGYIAIPGNTTYYIEPMKRLFPKATDDLIMYDRAHVVRMNEQSLRKTEEQFQCGTKELHESPDEFKSPSDTSNERNGGTSTEQETVNSEAVDKNWHVCHLHVFVDPTFWMHFRFLKYPAVSTDDEITDEIVKFLASHISMLKVIFRRTLLQTYDKSDVLGGIDFVIERTTVMTRASEKCRTQSENPICRNDLTSDEMMELIRDLNHDKYCLALFFTYHDFNGILGATLLSSPDKPGTGACDRCREDSNLHYSQPCAGNVGWITISDQDRPLPQSVSHIALAHQVGHSFGSPHDSGPDCVPGEDSPGGNFLMHDGGFFGGSYHRDEFSPCSKDNITRFLSAVIRGKHGKHDCLKKNVQNRTQIEPLLPLPLLYNYSIGSGNYSVSRDNYSIGKPSNRWKPSDPKFEEDTYYAASVMDNYRIVLGFSVVGLIAAVTLLVLVIMDGYCSWFCREARGQEQEGIENGFITESSV